MSESVNKSTDSNDVEPDKIRHAQQIMKQNRSEGLKTFNALFNSGKIPSPELHGDYKGELVALDIAPVVTQILEFIFSFWLPWKGKHLNKEHKQGDNLFSQSSRLIFMLIFPFYREVIDEGGETYRVFRFNTSESTGKVDTDLKIFKIDYDHERNPSLTIRRILDELVEIDKGVYLGKVHFKWWWGKWSLIAYFSLRA